jgi:hypothetical protein
MSGVDADVVETWRTGGQPAATHNSSESHDRRGDNLTPFHGPRTPAPTGGSHALRYRDLRRWDLSADPASPYDHDVLYLSQLHNPSAAALAVDKQRRTP